MGVGDLITDMADRFDPSSWGERDAVVQFNISGDDGGAWYAAIEGGKIAVASGASSNASMTLNCTAEDFRAMLSGELNGVSAFMQGRIKIDGDMSLAMKLQSLLGSAS